MLAETISRTLHSKRKPSGVQDSCGIESLLDRTHQGHAGAWRPPDFGRRKLHVGGRGEHGQVAAGRGGNRPKRVLYEVGKAGLESRRSHRLGW